MRVLIQRVSHASCTVEGNITGQIERGYLLFVGITHSDTEHICDLMADKIINLRINDVNGDILSISQFTLYANCTKARRPGFTESAGRDQAIHLYDYFNKTLRNKGMKVEEGIFGADMKIDLLNDGPITIMLDSEVIFNGK